MLKDKVAIVTGSTSGIGLGIAQVLAAAGCRIGLNGLGDAAEIERTRARIEAEHKVEVKFLPADMTRPADIAGMVQAAETAWGAVDILVNNAGVQHTALVEDFPDEKWDQIVAINLSAAFHSTKAAIRGMKARGYGRIVNIASAHGLVASPQKSAYVAAKHGIIGLTKAVALEAAGSGVTVNAICPGWVLTPLVQKQIADRAAREGIPEQQARDDLLLEKQPSGDFVTPAQLGGMVRFLAGAEAAQITGAALSVDGGWTAR